jgi:hypothetical protein
MTVAELLTRMSSEELTEWREHMQLDREAEERALAQLKAGQR